MSLCCDYGETLLLLKFVIMARCSNLIFYLTYCACLIFIIDTDHDYVVFDLVKIYIH